MRIVFLGATELGFNCCEAIIKAGHSVVGILTLGTDFSIKYKSNPERTTVKNYLFKDFKSFEEFGIPVSVARHPVVDYYKTIEQWMPDLIIVVGWYYMIPDHIMHLPSKGVVGIHASLLPKYRGNAPLVWAMINGEKHSGVSLFYIGEGTDNGDIIDQKSFPIDESDTISNVLAKAEEKSIELLQNNLPLIAEGKAARVKQNEAEATYFPKRVPEDGQVDWSWDIQRIKNFIRAQTKPYPGAFTVIDGKKVILWDADILPLQDAEN